MRVFQGCYQGKIETGVFQFQGPTCSVKVYSNPKAPRYQGLTLVHFSAQLEPCLRHKNSLHTLKNP